MKTIIAVIFLVFTIIIGMNQIEKDNAIFYNSLYGSMSQGQSENATIPVEMIKVSITGEVQKPGTYEVEKDSFLENLITLAGGLTSLSDSDCFDLYFTIDDQKEFYIAPVTDNEKISLNSASKEQLMNLTGVGRTLADRIVAYRDDNIDGFNYLEEIMQVDGIGKSIFMKIKDEIKL